MGLDRFIYFDNRVPTHDEIQAVLENYLGGCGSVSEAQPNRWLIDLPGKNTMPFKGIKGSHPMLADMFSDPDYSSRFIEVIFQRTDGLSPSIDVLTRHVDDFTNAIAARLAQAFASFYRGRLEDD